jgi:hypothetical protein
MKPAIEWDETYLLNLPTGEHDWIEIKDSRKLDFSLPKGDINESLNELSKQISAFANSGGGTLVYGLENTPIGKPRKIDSFGGVSLNLKNGTKEWLEDVIPDLVDASLINFNVYVLTNQDAEDSLIANDKGIFLIEIPSSEQAPHQANDNKYYARVAGKSRPLGHQFVSDIFGRAKYPKMQLYCLSICIGNEMMDKVTLIFTCKNVGKIYANYVNGHIAIPERLLREHYILGKEETGIRLIIIENIEKDVTGYKTHSAPMIPLTTSRYKPVLPGLHFNKNVDLDYTLDELSKFNDEKIKWTIHADNAPPTAGEFTIKDILDGKASTHINLFI